MSNRYRNAGPQPEPPLEPLDIDEPVHITKDAEDSDFQVHNLARNEGIWLQVENFDLRIKRTDEGIVVDIYDTDGADLGSIASTFAFDSDTTSFQGDA